MGVGNSTLHMELHRLLSSVDESVGKSDISSSIGRAAGISQNVCIGFLH